VKKMMQTWIKEQTKKPSSLMESGSLWTVTKSVGNCTDSVEK
jgi:hypothetical protein